MPTPSSVPNPGSQEFQERVAALSTIWDQTAMSGSSIEGLAVMASKEALHSSVQRSADTMERWMQDHLDLMDDVLRCREHAVQKLAEAAPHDRTHWRELVGFVFAWAVQQGGWNVGTIEDPEVNEHERNRRIEFQAKYFEAKRAAGYSSYEAVAKDAEISRATVLALEESAVIPRRATVEKLARLFGVSAADYFYSEDDD